MTYKAAVNDLVWSLHTLNAGMDAETHAVVLSEAAKLAEGTIAPLNVIGDRAGTPIKNGTPQMPAGFKDAYQNFCAGGWNGAPFSPDHGGQGLPWAVTFALNEIWQGANLAFGLCPLLTQGAIETILAHGTAEQIASYVPNMVQGTWTGTMNLTEPQAGSDLGQVKTMATPQADGTYRIKGQKIYITYGNHDMVDNIIHLVLARTPDAPMGSRGLSLFIAPKILADGTMNDVQSVSVEHKMGIHASPTCIMAFGDAGGAVGCLLGDLHAGLKNMFTMMNNARLSVGMQGVGISARATHMATVYANDRIQGKNLTSKDDKTVAIINHADVKRMLNTMDSTTQAARLLGLRAGKALDDGETALADLLTPLVKSYATDTGVINASLGVQVFGGMGFTEDAGIAQCYRDARILPIYEGTNGIQALDLVFRKVQRDQGAALAALITDLETQIAAAEIVGDDLETAKPRVLAALKTVSDTTKTLLSYDAERIASVATPYLSLVAQSLGGAYLFLSAAQAQYALGQGDFSVNTPDQLDQHIIRAAFFAAHVLPLAVAQGVVVAKT